MTVKELLRWQWEGYPRYHRARFNLLLHIVVVPLFLVGNVALVLALLRGAWMVAIAGVVAMIVSVVLQGRGHGRESTPPEPFTGPRNAVSRIFLEQWVTFPRFVLSGGWLQALRGAS
jgi:hypothetical protein